MALSWKCAHVRNKKQGSIPGGDKVDLSHVVKLTLDGSGC